MTSHDSSISESINFDDENSKMSIASSSSVETSNNSESQLNTCETIEKVDLKEECNKRSYLDGTWFVPDLSLSSSTGKVYGLCQICKSEHNKTSLISGTLHSSSNFKTHLKRVHSQKLTEFENYCLAKRQRLQSSQNRKNCKAYCDFSQREFEENIINYILDSFAPYNTVQQPSFRKIFDGIIVINKYCN